MNKTTSPFSSLDGLTQDERDDLSSIVRDLNHLHADMDKKQARGREIVVEQLKLKEREEELMDLVVSWVPTSPAPAAAAFWASENYSCSAVAHSGFAQCGNQSNLEWRVL